MLLEQQVLADLAMEELDRVHGEVELLPLANVRRLELLIGASHVLVGLLQLGIGQKHAVIGTLELTVGTGLDSRDGSQAGQGHEDGGAGSRDPRTVPRQPPHQGPCPRFTPGRHPLVGHPPLDVIGQVLARAITVFGLERHGLEADQLECLVDRGVELRGGGKWPRWTARNTSPTSSAANGGLPVSRQ